MNKEHKITTLKRVALLGCFFPLLYFFSCKELKLYEEPTGVVYEDGVAVSIPFIWERDVTEEGRTPVAFIPVFRKNTVVLAGAPSEGRGMLVALDLETGEEIWRWTDYVEGYDFEEVLSREQLNYKDNVVIFNSANRFCAVDLDNGTTLWKDKREGNSNSDAIQIVGNQYYFSFGVYENEVQIPTLMRGDLYSSAYEKIVEVPIDTLHLFGGVGGSYGVFKAPHIYIENQNKHAFMAFYEDIIKYGGVISYSSYNITTQTYDFEKVRLPDTISIGVNERPVMIGNMMIFNGGEFIQGVNKYTGELVWSRKDYAGRGNGVFITGSYKSRLFAVNNLGNTRRVMELDPATGRTLWLDEGRGGSTRPALYFLNDVMYFISRGDGRLYAYDINSRELLWKIRSPDQESYTTMQVLPGETPEDKGMLIAQSWKNAYRLEPAR